MTEAISDNIYRIVVPLPGSPLKSLNAYCITGQDRHLLIDTGFNQPTCLEALTAALRDLGVDRRRLDICITHVHADHAGLAAALTEGSDGTIWCSAGDGKIINEHAQANDEVHYARYAQRILPHGFSSQQVRDLVRNHPGIIYCSPVLSFTPIQDGDELRYGDCVLRVIGTPGHTPSHIALYEAGRKFLFAGDHILGDITPNITRWPEVSDSLGEYLGSLDAVSRLDIALTLPGHRSLIQDTQARIGQIQAHHARRLAEVRRILADGPASAYTIASRMTWEMRYASWEDFPVAQKWFAIGEALAHLDWLVARKEVEEQTRKESVLFAPHALASH